MNLLYFCPLSNECQVKIDIKTRIRLTIIFASTKVAEEAKYGWVIPMFLCIQWPFLKALPMHACQWWCVQYYGEKEDVSSARIQAITDFFIVRLRHITEVLPAM